MLEMAAAVVGGFDNLAHRPLVSLYAQPTTPLSMATMNEAMIEFAEARVPIVYAAAPMLGGSVPITLAGAHAICNAECLGGIVLSQLISPGTPFLFGVQTALLDMRTGSWCLGGPECSLGHLIVAQMAEYYRLPTFGSGGGIDSKYPDVQAGTEAFMSAFVNAAAGINLVHSSGHIAHALAGSLEMAVLCDEIFSYVERLLETIEVNEETLALGIIRRLGPGAHFMAEKHTRTHLEKGAVLFPKLFNRQGIPEWKAKGQLGAREQAKLKIRTILRDHKVPELPRETLSQIDRILAQASASMVKK